jgi:hypothetical protein
MPSRAQKTYKTEQMDRQAIKQKKQTAIQNTTYRTEQTDNQAVRQTGTNSHAEHNRHTEQSRRTVRLSDILFQ